MDNTQEFKILVTGDASSAVKATQQTGEATQKLKVDVSDCSDETKRALGILPPVTDELKKTGKASEEVSISHREQRESLRELTRGYPELGEVARAALNPITIAAFGIAEAFTIWAERMKTAQELLGGWQLPDFTAHAVGVSAAAEAYDKLKTAVAGADTEFDSAAGIFDRQAKAIQAQLTATTNLIAAQKEKAIADLDLQRASSPMSAGAYDAQRAMIEQGATDATTQARIKARSDDLAAKQKEAAKMAQDSAAEAAKANGIQPGLNDSSLQALIDKVKAGAAEAGKKAEEFKAESQHAGEVAERAQGGQGAAGLSDVVRNIPGDVGFFAKYGLRADPEEVKRMNEKAAKDADETQTRLLEQAAQLEKQKQERDKHNTESARLAAEAEKKRLELQGEDDPNKVGSVAWQNAQDTASQRTRDDTGLENSFSKDVENFNKDAAEYKKTAGRTDPDSINKARQAMADMYSLVNDAMSVMQALAADHQNVANLKDDIKLLQRQMGQISYSTH